MHSGPPPPDYALSMELKAAGFKGTYLAEYLAVSAAARACAGLGMQRPPPHGVVQARTVVRLGELACAPLPPRNKSDNYHLRRVARRWGKRPMRSATCAASAPAGPRATCRYSARGPAGLAKYNLTVRVRMRGPLAHRGVSPPPAHESTPQYLAHCPHPDILLQTLPAAQLGPAADSQVVSLGCRHIIAQGSTGVKGPGRSRSRRAGVFSGRSPPHTYKRKRLPARAATGCTQTARGPTSAQSSPAQCSCWSRSCRWCLGSTRVRLRHMHASGPPGHGAACHEPGALPHTAQCACWANQCLPKVVSPRLERAPYII